MIPATAPEQAVLAARTYRVYLKIEIQDALDAWLDYSDYVNQDFQYLAEVSIDIDARIAQARLELIRESSGNSLAPLLNSDIDVGRGVRISAARIAAGTTPVAGDFKPLFAGSIDEWGHPSVDGENDENRLSLVARDGLADLMDRWVEEETDYGSDDGVLLETAMQKILDDWADGAQLYVPIGTSTNAGLYRQQKMSVLDALQQLADLIGWVIEYRWDSVSASWRITLYEPDRAPAATQWTFGPQDYFAVSQLHVARYDIRNAVTVRYTDANGVRDYYPAVDDTSIGKYGRRWMEIEEADDSPINSETMAQAMAEAALLDLAEPVANQEIVGPLFWPVQLGDFYEWLANAVHYDTDQEFGVTGYTHLIENGEGETRVRTRGRPAGSVRGWLRREHRPRPQEEAAAARAIQDFREVSRTPTEVTYRWRLGSDLMESWIHDFHRKQPYSDDQWPDALRSPELVTVDREVEYTVDVPEQEMVAYLQVEGRLADGSIGDMERANVFPANVPGDYIAFAQAVVDQEDGSVSIFGVTTDRARSIAYAYNVGPASSTSTPSVAETEAQGDGADGGGLLSGFTSDFEITLPAGTVSHGEVIRGLLISYINADGTGPDGTAQDHHIPVGFFGERIKLTDPDQIATGIVIANKLTESSKNFGSDIVWSATDWDTIAWSAGTITMADGSTYSILAGNTGNMGSDARRYVYLDPAVSATVLQVTTSIATATGENKVLLAEAARASGGSASGQSAHFVPVVGAFFLNADQLSAAAITEIKVATSAITTTKISDDAVTTPKIVAGAITTAKIDALAVTADKIAANAIIATKIAAGAVETDKLAANAVTAAKINVASLSAISADLGTVTAGTIQANVIIAADTFTAPTAVFSGTVQVDNALLVLGDLQHDGTFAGFFGTTAIAKPTVSGARDDPEGALKNLLIALGGSGLGLITDSTTAT